MKKIYLTVDVECHDISLVNQYIWGRSKKDESGLKKILELGKEMDVIINFFVDFPEVIRYGEKYLLEIVSLIKSYNQPIHLHVHPNYISGNDYKTFLWEYSYKEQKEILEKSRKIYLDIMKAEPTAFRAGRYGVDENTYKALYEVMPNIIDCSYSNGNKKMCHLSKEIFGSRNGYKIFNKIKCIPTTSFIIFDLFGIKKWMGIDLAQMHKMEYISFLKDIKGKDFILTMHSWHFIDRKFWNKTENVKIKSKEIKKFKEFINLSKKEKYEFLEINLKNFNLKQSEDFEFNYPKNFKNKMFSLIINFLRFQEISKINKKYFKLYLFFYISLIISIFMLFYFIKINL